MDVSAIFYGKIRIKKMSLLKVLKRRQDERMTLRKKALKEAERLVLLLRQHFDFEYMYIYGSVLTDKFTRTSDIDMAIKGLKIEDFFKAHALLIRESSFSIDLKPFEDMTEDFRKTILTKGRRLG